MPDALKESFSRRVEAREGDVHHLYVDLYGYVTVGIGSMLDIQCVKAAAKGYEESLLVRARDVLQPGAADLKAVVRAACEHYLKAKAKPHEAASYAKVGELKWRTWKKEDSEDRLSKDYDANLDPMKVYIGDKFEKLPFSVRLGCANFAFNAGTELRKTIGDSLKADKFARAAYASFRKAVDPSATIKGGRPTLQAGRAFEDSALIMSGLAVGVKLKSETAAVFQWSTARPTENPDLGPMTVHSALHKAPIEWRADQNEVDLGKPRRGFNFVRLHWETIPIASGFLVSASEASVKWVPFPTLCGGPMLYQEFEIWRQYIRTLREAKVDVYKKAAEESLQGLLKSLKDTNSFEAVCVFPTWGHETTARFVRPTAPVGFPDRGNGGLLTGGHGLVVVETSSGGFVSLQSVLESLSTLALPGELRARARTLAADSLRHASFWTESDAADQAIPGLRNAAKALLDQIGDFRCKDLSVDVSGDVTAGGTTKKMSCKMNWYSSTVGATDPPDEFRLNVAFHLKVEQAIGGQPMT